MYRLRLCLLAIALSCAAPGCGAPVNPVQKVSVQEVSEQRAAVVQLRVLSYNLRHDRDHWKARFDLIANELTELRPHIIGAQEVEIGIDQTRALADRLAVMDGPKYYVFEHLKHGKDAVRGEGIAIYSQYPFIDTDWHTLSHGRIALFARIELPDKTTLDIYNTHLHDKGGDSLRVQQASALLDWITEKSKRQDVILLGDFNADPHSKTIRHIRGHFQDAHALMNPEVDGFTTPIRLSRDRPEQTLLRRIDYVFLRLADARWRLETVENVMKKSDDTGLMPSDHLGVLAALRMHAP